ncbi:MBL fold metallo-hydrolase [Solitalea koreensis]|uniref:Phosphoribosyl 1,2-cyclic phosphate phosphodiesterase n=1 Tax=Solitalea koreensis TaxID=543615 RepID=A0A521DPV2_9SPHI|nr:MBL fold metallo-hydrolase [Solitalea koreensis]SMO73668.1 phosphoribosyl 1,2-cyclic phosphate phosphodiesterase [Solitalea koreensis]
MKITFLGTGTSQGVPVIACDCNVCTSADARDKRLRSSIWVEDKHASIVIDSGPDFRYQMLRAKVKKLDAIVFTHEHKDHVAGLDDVRAFNFKHGREIDIYATDRVQEAIIREFAYIFATIKYPGIPKVNLIEIQNKPFHVHGIKFVPIEVLHYKLPVLGYRIGDFTYITDAKTIAPNELKKVKGSKIVVLNALQLHTHVSHFTLEEAIAMAQEIGAETTYFTHISHRLGKHADIEKELPAGIKLAYDGLVLDI